MAPIPVWLVDETEIVGAADRHLWMCTQLRERRLIQAEGTSAYPYGRILGELFDVRTALAHDAAPREPEKVFEVLSDGLGYIEPNWHGIELTNGTIDVITPKVLESFKGRVRTRRNTLSVGTRTQRAVGNLLYESALFALSNESIWLLSTDPPSERWVQLSTGDDRSMPLKFGGGNSTSQLGDPAASLLAIAQKVLWPSYLVGAPLRECVSLVLLHTSLWHEAAGVWAFHARFRGATAITPRPPVLSSLRSLVAPAVCCLEDVTGWAYQREGLHKHRRHNVNFLYHCLGIPTPPTWDPDGLGSAGPDRERDAAVYNLPADAPLSVTTRLILRTAMGESTCTCGNWTAVELGFTAARLVWQRRPQLQQTLNDPMPSTVQLYAKDLLGRLNVDRALLDENDVTTMIDNGVEALVGTPDLCETCAPFVANLGGYWTLVKGIDAQG